MAVSIKLTGLATSGTGNLTPAIPAGAVAGDMMLCIIGTKPYNGVNTMPTGWLSLGSATDGTVAAGVDTGSMKAEIFWKEHDGSEANPTVTNASNNVSAARILVYQKDAAASWVTPVGSGGGDGTAGTGFSITTTASLALEAGDVLPWVMALRSDLPQPTNVSVTGTGLTITGTVNGIELFSTTAGGDMAMHHSEASVDTGTATTTLTLTATLDSSHTGSVFFARLREQASAFTPVDPMGMMGFFGL